MPVSTPICDFVDKYINSGAVRAHMPGHKGVTHFLGEPWDITEIDGADSLYEACGIIAESENNASKLFGFGRTVYSTEGSTQCIKAMLFLAMGTKTYRDGRRPTIIAGRNVHKAFIYACALLDIDVFWLMPEGGAGSVCSCPITSAGLEKAFAECSDDPFAVYITAPDYLGGSPDIGELAAVCHQRGVPLLVDNAHGAYLKFLDKSLHPIDLGADISCDSAHKTLPVLTGGAYLHISDKFITHIERDPKTALSMFGSTSPSYLILQSLDKCNRYLSEGYFLELSRGVKQVSELKRSIAAMGYLVGVSDPLKLTVYDGSGGHALAKRLRREGIECEFADRSAAVLMFTPDNTKSDFERIRKAFSLESAVPLGIDKPFDFTPPEKAMSIRQAVFSDSKRIKASRAEGLVCAAPVASCPPAVPVAVSGEVITRLAVEILGEYEIKYIDVVAEK
ncbi:MAG: amino acid decarboxylase [Clostridiaceae bacterium]|nr:amino acid decarboxylase [Clostridiaceae bacterium]